MGQTYSFCSRCGKNKATIMVIYKSNETFPTLNNPRNYIPNCVDDYYVSGRYNYDNHEWNVICELRTCLKCIKDSDFSNLVGFERNIITRPNGFNIPGSLP